MTTGEFSTEFDVLYNNITSNQAPGLNEYEKSVLLTKAQSQILIEYFNNRIDNVGGGYDGSQKRQYDFSSIIKTVDLVSVVEPTTIKRLNSKSKLFYFPGDYFLSVNEVLYAGDKPYTILPISYSEYQLLMLKPYHYPVKNAAWRLITNNDSTPVAEIIGRFKTDSLIYTIRYIPKLNPIILDDLGPYGMTIENKTAPNTSELPSEMHRDILDRAVLLAKVAWQNGIGVQQAGQQ